MQKVAYVATLYVGSQETNSR